MSIVPLHYAVNNGAAVDGPCMQHMTDTAVALQHIIRKERAVGLIPGAPTIYEVLEELAITVQQHLVDAPLPFCAFNGGGDVFVDVGNKSLGLEALMQYLKFNPSQV